MFCTRAPTRFHKPALGLPTLPSTETLFPIYTLFLPLFIYGRKVQYSKRGYSIWQTIGIGLVLVARHATVQGAGTCCTRSCPRHAAQYFIHGKLAAAVYYITPTTMTAPITTPIIIVVDSALQSRRDYYITHPVNSLKGTP